MPALILLRHGLAAMPANTCVGQLDVDLTPAGKAGVAATITRWACARPQHIYCSDLKRCRQTAELLKRHFKIPITLEPRLRELDFGQWEGLSWGQIHASQPQALENWGRDWVDTAPPGGETGRQLYQRVQSWYEQQTASSAAPALVVGHAGSLRALLCLAHQQAPEQLFDYHLEHANPLPLI